MSDIRRIAQDVRRKAVEEYGPDLAAACILVSRDLQIALERRGIECCVIGGYVRLDKPLPDGSNEHLHFWNEVEGELVDVSGSQFNPNLSAPLPEVLIGAYADHACYHKNGVHGRSSLGKPGASGSPR